METKIYVVGYLNNNYEFIIVAHYRDFEKAMFHSKNSIAWPEHNLEVRERTLI